jgi:hypothetical protein
MTSTYTRFGELPCHPRWASTKAAWYGMDSPEAYRSHGGHSDYGPDDIVYDLNSLGFRAPEFDVTADMRVLAIGCSFVFGVGLAREHLFHERLCARLGEETGLSIVDLNLGTASSSNDFICHLLQLAVPLLAPDLVLVHFTFAARRDYLSADGERVGFNPSARPADPRHREIQAHFLAVSNPQDDRLNLLRNYLAVAALLRGTRWLCSFTNEEHLGWLGSHLLGANSVGVLPELDRARDNQHPGIRSHMRLSEAYWETFVRNGWLAPPEAT